MNDLMGANKRINREQLGDAWQTIEMGLPEATKTWVPIPYPQFADRMRGQAAHAGFQLVKEQYSLSKAGSQFFGVQSYKSAVPGLYIALGLRGSVNKTLAEGVTSGSSVIVCDNGIFQGDAYRQVRKNTPMAWPDICAIINAAVNASLKSTFAHENFRRVMAATPVPLHRGYEILGRLVGGQHIGAHTAAVAFEDWRNPRHEEFSTRNAWSLYNCVTEGLKSVAPGRQIEAHSDFHRVFPKALTALA